MVERRVTILTQLVDRISKPLDQISKNFSQVNTAAEAASSSFRKVTVSARPIAAGLKNAGRAAATTVVGLTGVATSAAAASAGVGAVAATTVAGAGGLATLAGSAAPVVDNLGEIGERSKVAATDLAAIGARGIETAGKLGTLTESLKAVGLNIRAAFVERGRQVEFDAAIERRADAFRRVQAAAEVAAEAQRALNRQRNREAATTEAALARQEKALASREAAVKSSNRALKEATDAQRIASKEVDRLTKESEELAQAEVRVAASLEKVTAATRTATAAWDGGADAQGRVSQKTRDAIQALSDNEKQAKKTATTFSKLLKTLRPLIAGFAGIALVRRSFAAAQQQAEAEAGLFQALRGNVQEFEKLNALAKEIQSRTVVGDEEVLRVLALLANAEVGFDRLGVSIEAIVQASAALQKPLDTVATQLLQTLAGEVPRTLKALVPTLQDLTKEELAAGAAFDVIARSLGGAAEAIARTPFGKFEQTTNRLGDSMEKLGDVLVTVVNPAVETVTDAVEGLVGAFDDLVGEDTREGLKALTGGTIELAVQVGALTGAVVLLFRSFQAGSLAAIARTTKFASAIGVGIAIAVTALKLLEIERERAASAERERARGALLPTQQRQEASDRRRLLAIRQLARRQVELQREGAQIAANVNEEAQEQILAQERRRLDRLFDLERISASKLLAGRLELEVQTTDAAIEEAKRRIEKLQQTERARRDVQVGPTEEIETRGARAARVKFLSDVNELNLEIQKLTLDQAAVFARLAQERTQFSRAEVQAATELQSQFRTELGKTRELVAAGTITIEQGFALSGIAGAKFDEQILQLQDRLSELFSGEGVDFAEFEAVQERLFRIIDDAAAATDATDATFTAARIKRTEEIAKAEFRVGQIRLNQNAEIQNRLVALQQARVDRLVELDQITPGEASAERQRLALQLVNVEIAEQEAALLRLSEVQIVSAEQREEQVQRQLELELALQDATVSRQEILLELSNQRTAGFQAEIEGATEALAVLDKLEEELQGQIEAGEITVVEAQLRQAAAVETFRMAVAAAREELRLLGSGEDIDPVEFEQRVAELNAILQEGLVTEELKQEVQSLGEFLVANLEAPLKGLFSDLISGTKSVRNAFADMLGAMADQIAQFLIQQAVQGLLGLLGGVGAPGAVGFSLGFNEGGPVRRLAEGGGVPGTGPNVDSIPAMLTPGEFVMRRSAVQHYGASVMEGLNRMVVPADLIRHFRAVGRTPSPSGGFQRGGEVADEVMAGSTPQVLPVMVAEPATVERFLRGGAAGLMRVLAENADELSSITQAARGSV